MAATADRSATAGPAEQVEPPWKAQAAHKAGRALPAGPEELVPVVVRRCRRLGWRDIWERRRRRAGPAAAPTEKSASSPSSAMAESAALAASAIRPGLLVRLAFGGVFGDGSFGGVGVHPGPTGTDGPDGT